ncbi:hypothetical protein GF324_03270 [bacterium]|nr:hypothetical protein [bacterium]
MSMKSSDEFRKQYMTQASPLTGLVLVIILLTPYLPGDLLLEADFLLANPFFRLIIQVAALGLFLLYTQRSNRFYPVLSMIMVAWIAIELLTVMPVPFFRSKPDRSSYSQPIHALTYNIQGGRTDRLLEWIESQKPDIVGLQEYYPFGDGPQLKVLEDRGYQTRCARLYRRPVSFLGLAVRGEIVHTDSFRLAVPGNDPRQVLTADAVFNSDTLRIVVAHMEPPLKQSRFFGIFQRMRYRYLQSRELADSLNAWSDRRLLLLMDGNAAPRDRSLSPLQAAMNDTWMEAGSGWGGTWDSTLPVHRIDYILQRGFTAVLKAERHNIINSDHLAYMVALMP